MINLHVHAVGIQRVLHTAQHAQIGGHESGLLASVAAAFKGIVVEHDYQLMDVLALAEFLQHAGQLLSKACAGIANLVGRALAVIEGIPVGVQRKIFVRGHIIP